MRYPGQGRAVLAETEVDRTESAQIRDCRILYTRSGNAEQRERAECHYPASAPLDGETEIVMLHIHVAGVIHAGDCVLPRRNTEERASQAVERSGRARMSTTE